MARPIETIIDVNIGCKIVNYLTNGTKESTELFVDDKVNGFKFVTGNTTKTINGRITDINVFFNKNTDTTSNLSSSTLEKDSKVSDIVIDSSRIQNADVYTVEPKNVLEYQASGECFKVRVLPVIKANLKITLSDDTVSEVELREGTELYNVVYFDGKSLATGNFKVVSFIYKSTGFADNVKITGVTLKNLDTKMLTRLSFTQFTKTGTAAVEASNADDIVNALVNSDDFAVINVNNDIVMTESLSIASGKTVILNLGNNSFVVGNETEEGTVTNNNDVYLIDNAGDLTINGGVFDGKGINNQEGATLTINDIDITTEETTTGGGALINNGTLIFNSGIVKTNYEGSTSDSKGPACIRTYGNLTINGGDFESISKRTYAIIQGTGNITISEDANITVNGVHGGIAIDGGTAVINSGTYISTEFYGLYVSNDGIDRGTIDAVVTVNGGTFDGKKYSVWIGSDVNDPVNSTIAIHDGIFLDPLNAEAKAGDKAIVIDGGKFSTQVPDKFVAEGYTATTEPDDDGYYTVVAS